MLVVWAQSTFITHDQLRIPSFVELVSFNLLLPKKMTPESRGSLPFVAHVAQWIERLPPEQKVVGPIPTVGAKKVVDTLVVSRRTIWSMVTIVLAFFKHETEFSR